jgi:2-polyprenyl-6-methoxyphenol hydroxylase-like FAD-dependent oxidoreductase
VANPFDCDILIAGGGPAGSVAAAWLARAGRRVRLFERDQFPRFHIGESLLASANDVLEAIGADAVVRQARFPEKWGASFMTADGRLDRYAFRGTSEYGRYVKFGPLYRLSVCGFEGGLRGD